MIKEKYECHLCGVYYWVDDRDDFDCPNCTNKLTSENDLN